jgi:hypothetical protein
MIVRLACRFSDAAYTSSCPMHVSTALELAARIRELQGLFSIEQDLSFEQGYPLLTAVEQMFSILFNVQCVFSQPRPYSGADSENLFATFHADELANIPEYGQTPLMPIRLYLKESTYASRQSHS